MVIARGTRWIVKFGDVRCYVCGSTTVDVPRVVAYMIIWIVITVRVVTILVNHLCSICILSTFILVVWHLSAVACYVA